MKYLLSILFLFQIQVGISQFGIGATASTDLYQRYANPEDGIASRSAGSALLNFGFGPKIWFGTPNMSLSIESQANLGVFALSLGDYKGLGAVSFPIIAKLNFGGMSAFTKEFSTGLTIGGGIQYNRTELFGVSADFEQDGVTRSYFRTYVVHLGYGFSVSGFCGSLFIRYGFNSDIEANSFNFGLQYDFNVPMLKKIDDPASAL